MKTAPHECPVARMMEVISGRWKPTILYHLKGRTRRFNELRRLMPEVTQRMLTLHLRELEADGIVVRTVYDQTPPRVDYSLSAYGWTLGPIFDAMEEWGERHHRSVEPRRAAG